MSTTDDQQDAARRYLDENTAPMRASELHPCSICGGPLITKDLGLLSFAVLDVATAIVDPFEAHRQAGQDAMMGPLSHVLGLDRVVARVTPKTPVRLLLCYPCANRTTAWSLTDIGEEIDVSFDDDGDDCDDDGA